MPSGIVTSRCTGRPCWSRFRIPSAESPGGIRNSPAWTGSDEPSRRAKARNVPARPRIAPACSSWPATRSGRPLLDYHYLLRAGRADPERHRAMPRRAPRSRGEVNSSSFMGGAMASDRPLQGWMVRQAESLLRTARTSRFWPCAAQGSTPAVPSLVVEVKVGGTIWSRQSQMRRSNRPPGRPSNGDRRWRAIDMPPRMR